MRWQQVTVPGRQRTRMDSKVNIIKWITSVPTLIEQIQLVGGLEVLILRGRVLKQAQKLGFLEKR